MASTKGLCFVIAPIGEADSSIRKRSDKVLKHIIEPAARECGYDVLRADKITRPGIITTQVIQHLVDDPLVVADLTGQNANVFYELAVRHAIKRPVAQIIAAGEAIPFDLASVRTVPFDITDPDSIEEAKIKLTGQIQSVEADPAETDNPISMSLDLKALRNSGDPVAKSHAEILDRLGVIQATLDQIRAPGASALDAALANLAELPPPPGHRSGGLKAAYLAAIFRQRMADLADFKPTDPPPGTDEEPKR